MCIFSGDSALWPGPGLIRLWWDRSSLTVRPSCRHPGPPGSGSPWSASVQGSLGGRTASSWFWTGPRAKTRATIAAITRMSRPSLTAQLPSAFMYSSGVSKNYSYSYAINILFPTRSSLFYSEVIVGCTESQFVRHRLFFSVFKENMFHLLLCSSLARLCGPFSLLFLFALGAWNRSPVWIWLQYQSDPWVIRTGSYWLCLSNTLEVGRINVFGIRDAKSLIKVGISSSFTLLIRERIWYSYTDIET